jgi:mannose-1-phosphate guanylyltransferase / phosphomannomutase
MKVVVMAGGQGSRLRPLTSNQPKPMLPIVGRPMMEHSLRLARRHGLHEVVATVQFLASIVRNHFGDGSDLGLSISYATEEEPLGTAGSVKNAQPLLDERTLVLSGDALCDVDLTDLVAFHERSGAAVTVTLKRVENPLEFGIVIRDEDGRVERFLEKPGWGDVFSDTVNTGIYVIEREVLDAIPEGESFDFARDLFPALLERGVPIFGYVTDRYWTDVGTLAAYHAAHHDVLDRRVEVEMSGFELRPRVWLGEGAEVDPDAQVEAPAFIGANSKVEGGATLREYTVLGRGVAVKSGAYLHRAVVHDYVYVGTSAALRGCVVGKNSDVKYGAKLEEGVVVADQCHIGEGAVLNPHVKVYPFKVVDAGAIVSKSIVWQSGGYRGLFGERGITGLVNVDITPETALRLALAQASLLPRGAALVACRDATKTARIIKRAMVVGLNAGGVAAHDLELVPAPVARFYARSGRALGGVVVRAAPYDLASVEIQPFDERGVDIGPADRRQMERAYYQDDLRRAFPRDIGELTFPVRGRDLYAAGLLDAVDLDALRERTWKLVVDCAFGTASLTVPHVLGRVPGEVLTINGVLDETRLIASEEDEARHLEGLVRTVQGSAADLAVLMDSTGERLRLVDGAGRVLDGATALMAFASLVSLAVPEARVALPVSTTREVERILTSRGGEVVWTSVSASGLMTAADQEKVDFAGDEDGGYLFPSFLAAPDALMGLVKLLELLSRAGTSLREVVDELPEASVVRLDVPVPWEAKGTVMRVLNERLDGGEHLDSTDGLKAYRGEDWTLVIPHPQEPVIRVWAEAGTREEAVALAAETVGLIEGLRA